MTSKKSNFLPLLLIGGGLAGAALLYGFGTKQSKEDSSLLGAVGVGGSGDFLGSSGISRGYDSTDLGIEDYAFNRATPEAFALPSDGAANPERVVDDSGAWTFADTAIVGLTAAAAVPTVAKAVKSAGSKVAGSAAGQAVKSAAGKVGATTAGKALSALGKGAGVLGVLGAVDLLFDVTGVKEAHFSQGGLTGNLQGVNTSFSTQKNTVTTDKSTSQGVGNVALTQRQKKYLANMETFGGSSREATAAEAAEINKRYGSSGSVGVYEYSGPTGKQITYITTNGKTVTNPRGMGGK